MQTLKMRIELRALKACVLSAAKKDARYYLNAAKKDNRYYCLNGVMVQPRAHDALCVATDGRRMTVARSEADGYSGETFELIIPLDKVQLAIKMAVKGQKTVSLESDENGSGYRLNGIPFLAIDGQFPQWRRVVPTIELDENGDQKPGNYNPAYLVDAAKSICAYAGVSPAKAMQDGFQVIQNGETGAAIVRGLDEGCFVVVMPIRIGKDFGSANTGREWTN